MGVPERQPPAGAAAAGYTPNHVPLSARLLRGFGALALIAWGAIGVMVDDLVLPTKTGALHLHGLAAWVMAAAMLCGAAVLVSVVVDHYDRRRNEAAYRRCGLWGARLGWILAGLSCGLLLAGIRYPQASDFGPWRAVAGVLGWIFVAAIGFANENAIERASLGPAAAGAAPARPHGGLALLGGFFVLGGTLAALAALPAVWWPTLFSAAVTASAGIVIAVIGALMYAARDKAAAAPQELALALRREPPLVRNWLPARIGILLLIGLWAVWWARGHQSDRWLAEDEAERRAAPAWKYRFDDFVGGMAMAEIRQRLSAAGFRMRCYGELGRNEQVAEGLRHIRIAFAHEHWPAVSAWFEAFDGVAAGKFGKDAGGSDILGRRGATGLLLISESRRTPAIMALWQARGRIAETACKSGEYATERWRLLCRDWPAPAAASR